MGENNSRELKQTDVARSTDKFPFKFRVMDDKGRLNSFGLVSF